MCLAGGGVRAAGNEEAEDLANARPRRAGCRAGRPLPLQIGDGGPAEDYERRHGGKVVVCRRRRGGGGVADGKLS